VVLSFGFLRLCRGRPFVLAGPPRSEKHSRGWLGRLSLSSITAGFARRPLALSSRQAAIFGRRRSVVGLILPGSRGVGLATGGRARLGWERPSSDRLGEQAALIVSCELTCGQERSHSRRPDKDRPSIIVAPLSCLLRVQVPFPKENMQLPPKKKNRSGFGAGLPGEAT